ncbi:MAG: hypothetical protein ACTSRG_22955 [Candidatus Helarchaeota archaeon]
MLEKRKKRSEILNSVQIPELRKFPYPYKAALSICSDIDGTDTYKKFKNIQSFMTEEIGIKFTNTFFPYHDDSYFSLFSGRKGDKDVIIEHIKNGMIDAIHSYGEKRDFSRRDALKALKELEQYNCKLDIWIDHAESRSNFCKYRFIGKGDIPEAKEYHFDLTKNFGIKFIWTERLTRVIGQGVPLSFRSLLKIYDKKYPLDSSINLGKTIAKIILGYFGYIKYNFFKDNELVIISTMRDGQRIYEFIRFNNFYHRDVTRGDTFEDLYYLISKRVLNHLKEIGGYSIIYVHLGKNFNLYSINGKKTIAALYNLKQELERGDIYVDSTSRILNYYIITKFLDWTFEERDHQYYIYIKKINDPVFGEYIPRLEQLENITFYVSGKAKLFVDNREISKIRYNPPDYRGRNSITIIK